MNPRIQELVLQATDTIEIVNPDTGITHHREFFDQEKFARLIVEECAQVSEDDITDGDACCTNTAYRISRQIKKHFGVEE